MGHSYLASCCGVFSATLGGTWPTTCPRVQESPHATYWPFSCSGYSRCPSWLCTREKSNFFLRFVIQSLLQVRAPSSNAHSGRVCHLPGCLHRRLCLVHPLRRRNPRPESDNCCPCQRRKSWMGHAQWHQQLSWRHLCAVGKRTYRADRRHLMCTLTGKQQPDLTRYTRRPKDAGWRQASSIFASKTLIFFFGIGATAAVQGKFGQAYWNQWDLLNAILDRFWGPAARAGCFFASFGMALSVLGVNVGCNAIPFGEFQHKRLVTPTKLTTLPGADITGLLPKVFTIVRGQLFCGLLSLAIVPWKLTTSGSAFLTFLGSYNIFIAPICSVS